METQLIIYFLTVDNDITNVEAYLYRKMINLLTIYWYVDISIIIILVFFIFNNNREE